MQNNDIMTRRSAFKCDVVPNYQRWTLNAEPGVE